MLERKIHERKTKNESENQKDLSTIILYRQNLIDSLQNLDYLIKLNHEETTAEQMDYWIEKGREAFLKLSELRGVAVMFSFLYLIFSFFISDILLFISDIFLFDI